MAEHIKVYEEKKKPVIWAWLLPILLLLILSAFFLIHRHAGSTISGLVQTAPAAAGAFPDLGTVHFDTDKATLTPEGQATLQRAADAMKTNPSAHLRVEGYTDNTGTTPHNDDLSVQRAQTVAAFLKGQGIDGSRLTGGGFGPSNPVASNSTQTGMADNRRVELFSQQ